MSWNRGGHGRWDRREPVDRLFGRADQALYRAKQAGRDRAVVARSQARDALTIVS